ncbi:MAG: glycosyltransferase family 4 protein [bacterium]|jgi:glycosyltransferase involved in cell wall biosynthesis
MISAVFYLKLRFDIYNPLTRDKKHIRVVVDIRDLQIAASGTRTFLTELITEFNKADHQFIFLYLDSSRKVYTGNKAWGKFTEQLKYFFWKQVQLPYKAFRLKADIVFCSDFMVPFFQLGFKTIPVFHDAFFWEYPEHYNKWWLTIFRGLATAAAKKSYCIVTPTLYSKKQIAAYTNIPHHKIVTIGEGPKNYPAAIEADRTPKPYLLHVGTLEKRKNIPTLIKAFKQLRDKGHDIQLILVGKASNKHSLDDSLTIQNLIRELNLQEHIQLTGYLPDEELPSLYKHALAYVFPSINEGFGIPVLEAFYYQTPLLIANNSCLPEVAGDAALSFDPYDLDDITQKIQEVIVHEEVRLQLIEKGKMQVEKYTWSKTAKHLMKIFIDAKG